MAHIGTVKFDALRALGYSGALTDMILAWQLANGGTTPTMPDSFAEMAAAQLTAAGGTPTGHAATDWYLLMLRLLGAEGGHYNDLTARFWAELGGVFP